ncbi:MAG: hypothetical protein V4643_04990 [Bacteroidota bacterium]
MIKHLPKIIFTVLLFAAMVLPRFNGNQSIVRQQSYDSKYFKTYVEYFRGEVLTAPLRPATNWRFGVPLLASYLPFDALTSINTVNLFFLALGIVIFFKTLHLMQVDINKRWYAIWIFICSFPTFYYSSIAYVDASLFFFIALSIYAAITNQLALFYTAILVGFCVKETIVIGLPFYFIYHYKKVERKLIIQFVPLFVLLLIEAYLIRHYAPVSAGDLHNKNWFWHSSLVSVKNNFTRFNTWFSMIASFGIPFVLYAIYNVQLIKRKLPFNSLQKACAASIIIAIGLYTFSYISTIADGRMIWTCYMYFLISWLDNTKQQVV